MGVPFLLSPSGGFRSTSLGMNPPPSTEAEAQTAITGPVEDRLEARTRRLLESGAAPPVATEAIQTDPDAAIRANVEDGMVQTKRSMYGGQARLGGRNIDAVMTPARMAQLFPDAREVELTEKQHMLWKDQFL